LLAIWGRTRKSVLFVTHDVREAVYLADRVAVMTARPGRIKAVLEMRLPRPRGADVQRSPEFVERSEEIWKLVREEAERAEGLPGR